MASKRYQTFVLLFNDSINLTWSYGTTGNHLNKKKKTSNYIAARFFLLSLLPLPLCLLFSLSFLDVEVFVKVVIHTVKAEAAPSHVVIGVEAARNDGRNEEED